MQFIDIQDLPAQQFNVVLDDQYCTITLRQKAKRIYLDLATPDNIICNGAICLDGVDILQSPDPNFLGTLHFFDTLGTSAPYYEGLNTRYWMLFVGTDEILPDTLRF